MRPNEYRARAEECDEMAKQPPSFGVNKLYATLARHWRELAVQAEERECASDPAELREPS
jgi:hypothetical protein